MSENSCGCTEDKETEEETIIAFEGDGPIDKSLANGISTNITAIDYHKTSNSGESNEQEITMDIDGLDASEYSYEASRDTGVVQTSPVLRIAIHGLSELINTRLSPEALDICLELIEAGVQPKAIAEVVLHILDVKVKKHEREHGPMLP